MRAEEWSGALALEAVRQQQHDPPSAGPTWPGRGADELVDHDLGAVDEVAELGLPHARASGRATE